MLKGRSYLVKKPEYILTDIRHQEWVEFFGEVQYVSKRKLLKMERKAKIQLRTLCRYGRGADLETTIV